MSAAKNACYNTVAYVLLDIQVVSSIKPEDAYLGSRVLVLARGCPCDFCTAVTDLFHSAQRNPWTCMMPNTALGVYYKAKVMRTKNRSFKFRGLRALYREIMAHERVTYFAHRMGQNAPLSMRINGRRGCP